MGALPLLMIFTLKCSMSEKTAASEEIFPSFEAMKAITAKLAIVRIIITILVAYCIVQPHIRGSVEAYIRSTKDLANGAGSVIPFTTVSAAAYKVFYGEPTGAGDNGDKKPWSLSIKFRPLLAVTVFNWMFYLQITMIVMYFVAHLMQSSDEPKVEAEEKPAAAAATGDVKDSAAKADEVTIDVAPENAEAKPAADAAVEDEAVKSEPEAQEDEAVEEAAEAQDEAVEPVAQEDEAVEEALEAEDEAVEEAPVEEAEAVEAPVEEADEAAPEAEVESVASEAPVAEEAVEAPVEEPVDDEAAAPEVAADIQFDDNLPAPEEFPQIEDAPEVAQE